MNERTAVYRLYDAADALLYVGITDDLLERMGRHAATKDWWPLVAWRDVQWHSSRDLASAEELRAIVAERPRYNVARSPWAPGPRQLTENEASVSALRANLSDAVARVHFLRRPIAIVDQTRARRPMAYLVPADLALAINAAGGPDKVLAQLQSAD